MAEVHVAVHGHHHRYTSSFGSNGSSVSPTARPSTTAPVIEMLPNPDFSFPALPPPSSIPTKPITTGRRPASMHFNAAQSQSNLSSHRRAASTLPSFTFNAADTSGLDETATPPLTPNETEAVTPSRRGHRRGGSEFVGGDSRLGVDGAISSSPTKTTGFPLPVPSAGPPAGRRGHAHRRSAAMSSHDVSSIMQPPQPQPPLSSSLPTTPLEFRERTPPFDRASSAPGVVSELYNIMDSSTEDAVRPPSRRVVGFSENVEYIPRPLSTISSDTEGSLSTIRGHSVNNSISSMLSLSVPSPQSARNLASPLSTTFENEPKPRARSSLEISKRIEKEGEWLKGRPSLQETARPLSDSAALSPRLAFARPESPVRPRNPHNKRHSLSHALSLGRRRSEPWISTKASDLSRVSSISLQDDARRASLAVDGKASRALDHKSSTRKIKDWAVSKMGRKSKDVKTAQEEALAALVGSHSTDDTSVPGKVPIPEAETDLDAVFSSHADSSEPQRSSTPTESRVEFSIPMPSQSTSFQTRYADDASGMVDLDAALGPFKTPSLGGHRQRRELHSSRLAKDFGGPGMHYHRRAESLPALPAPEFGRGGTPQLSMDDVLEDEEEETPSPSYSDRPTSSRSAEAAGIGIQIVDSDIPVPGSPFNLGSCDNFRNVQCDWEPERPSTSYGSVHSRLSTPVIERRASSLIEETIMEESSPVEALEIVGAHEEPRASSLTKSSDSSETPTLLQPQSDIRAFPESQQSLTTPENYTTSTFSSPDFSRRQGSFDTSRVGTSASSITDNRTMSSYVTSEHGHDMRMSVDEPVPSLTSSRSTMMSTMHANGSRRDFSNERRPSAVLATPDPAVAAQKRRNRASIQSLSQLVGGSFSGRSKASDETSPPTATEPNVAQPPKRKEHRLKKLMFWRSKSQSKQSLHG